MALNCKLNKDISLGSGQDACMLTDINVGLSDGLYLFNKDDVQNLVFDGDSRPDESLFIDTIITSQPFYRVDATNISYTEEYEDHKYTHNITASIKSVRNEIEEILEGAVHGLYLAAFKVVGEEHYRLVGWKEGLSLDEELSMSSDNNSYSLTLSGLTTYPSMEVDKDNFDLSKKVYEPIFKPLFQAGNVTCSSGWAIANYVVKVNAAGMALDSNNKLVQYSGNQQDAYKLQGVTDADYHILGTYNRDASFEGISVKTYDTSLCSVSCSISIYPSSITLNSSVTSSTISVTSSNDWEIVSYPSYVTLSRTYGGVNDQTVYVYGDGTCGTETLTFRNKVGGCTTTLSVSNNIIKIGSIFYYPNRTSTVTLSPIVCGTYTATVNEGAITVNSDGSFTVTGISGSDSEKNVTVTLTSGSETKVVTLVIQGINTARGRKAISEYCVDN